MKRAALLVPPIRRMKEQRDVAQRQVGELSRQLANAERKAEIAHQGLAERQASAERQERSVPVPASVDSELLVSRSVERAVLTIREEFTTLPRFAYHLPLDYEAQTLPPQFDPPVWVDGEILPLPPSSERHGHDDSKYLQWGRYDHDVILSHIRQNFPSTEGLSIMDFGCSSGRVLRHFLPEMLEYGWKLTGVDVSARRIEWMRRNFPPEFQVYAGSVLPSMPFESNSFDVIYGLSVFTHIKFLWDAWLLELRRILKPGGLLIQTVHTENAWKFFYQQRNEAWARDALGPMRIEAETLPEDFVYFGDIGKAQTFWKKEVAAAFWSRYFQEVTIFPPPEEYWYQDWVVAKKPKPDAASDLSELKRRVVSFCQAAQPGAAQDAYASTNGDSAASGTSASVFVVDQDFSQHGEQPIILDFFSKCPGNFRRYCVDAGAYDGVVGSNSRALLLNGWEGVVIEPNPRVFARLQNLYANRPEVRCIQKAVSGSRQDKVTMNFCIGPPGTPEGDKWKYAQVSSLHDAWAESCGKELGWAYETSTVSSDTLNAILRDVGAPKEIGFLSIDCEGEDLNVVRHLDLDNFRPLFICVEAGGESLPPYAQIFEPKGYVIHAHTHSNTFWRLNTV